MSRDKDIQHFWEAPQSLVPKAKLNQAQCSCCAAAARTWSDFTNVEEKFQFDALGPSLFFNLHLLEAILLALFALHSWIQAQQQQVASAAQKLSRVIVN